MSKDLFFQTRELEFLKETEIIINQNKNKMGKIAKVTNVQANGTWDSDKHGTFFKFDYEFDDNNGLQAMHKTKEGAFKVGDTVEYEVTKMHPEYGNSGKVTKPKDQPHSNGATVSPDVWRKKDVAIIYQNALTQANTFYNVVGYQGKTADQSLQVLMDTAEVIAKFVINKSGI